jgi:hypothetical protein
MAKRIDLHKEFKSLSLDKLLIRIVYSMNNQGNDTKPYSDKLTL